MGEGPYFMTPWLPHWGGQPPPSAPGYLTRAGNEPPGLRPPSPQPWRRNSPKFVAPAELGLPPPCECVCTAGPRENVPPLCVSLPFLVTSFRTAQVFCYWRRELGLRRGGSAEERFSFPFVLFPPRLQRRHSVGMRVKAACEHRPSLSRMSCTQAALVSCERV